MTHPDPTEPPAPEPDTQDWTVVLEKPCPECGFDPTTTAPESIPQRIREAKVGFVTALERPDAADRPQPQRWSVVEYGQHVADVTEVMARRLQLILDGAGTPVSFDSWDADEAAVQNEYWKASPEVTTLLLRQRLDGAADTWAAPAGEQWSWQGVRGDGFGFTAATLGVYFAHELRHHLADVTP